MREITAKLPNANIIYFGDTARVPYGEKSPDTIVRYALESGTFLQEKGVDIIVIACNTASAFAIDALRERFSVPVLAVIEPGAKRAVETTTDGHIAVIGTRGTISSGVYEKAIIKLMPEAKVTALACPLFVPIVEEGFESHAVADLIVNEYLGSIKEKGIDTLLLGCTHYPLLKPMIKKVLGEKIAIVDSAGSCAEGVFEECSRLNVSNPLEHHLPAVHQFYVSDDPVRFKVLGERFLKHPITSIEKVSLEASLTLSY